MPGFFFPTTQRFEQKLNPVSFEECEVRDKKFGFVWPLFPTDETHLILVPETR